MGLQKDKKLNKLMTLLPEGVAAPSSWFEYKGYSRQLVRKYVQGKWLVALGRGVYAHPTADVNWQGLVLGIQQLAELPFHVGGISALNLEGYAHYLPLGGEKKYHLWGQAKVPAWVKAVTLKEELQFHTSKIFDSSDNEVATAPSGVRDWVLQVSTPERAIMEVLYDVRGDAHSFTHAMELFEGLTTLRPSKVNHLLQHCKSVKVKRLFLFMMEQFSYSWIKRVEIDRIDLGSGKRVVVKGGKLNKKYMITVPETYAA
ncbi:Ynd [hydrothermal vent metagenome]|uniref:Ynd n=1 Tax=hydrothermal vent metagenome TaxID=652676 RepID=A0A3B1AB03_9ZZZZ